MNKEIDRFKIITREGKNYTVIVTQAINTATTRMGMMVMPGKKKMKTLEEGFCVKKNSTGVF